MMITTQKAIKIAYKIHAVKLSITTQKTIKITFRLKSLSM